MRAHLAASTLLAIFISTAPAQAQGCGADAKPALWCAWWLRRYLHIPCEAFPPYQWNLARAFAKLGTPAPRGCVGCVAVFARGKGGHVGVVTSWDNGNPVILSGNVRNQVTTGPRPASNLIALRYLTALSQPWYR